MQRKTSIIILTYNNLDYTKQCLKSIEKYTENGSYEIIIVDNNSTDGTKEFLKNNNNYKIIFNDINVGFPKGCNQAIAIANSDNDILLLNNDTVVTHNWLKNLKVCLESSTDVGAVGSVCNQNENIQGVDFTYDNLKQMQNLATKNNISNPEKWEEKLFLIGFCLLIKREVINKLKQLDENYSPGYIEDNDLSLRIIKQGYKLLLCHDSFIHHYLGTSFRKDMEKFYEILNKNRDYFFKKWKFNTFAFDEVKSASFPLINNPSKVLDFSCGIGTTVLSLKYKYKNIIIHGVEKNVHKRNIAENFCQVFEKLSDSKKNYYDYILIGNILEKIENIEEFLTEIKKHLSSTGYIVGEFSNASSIKKINKMLNGDTFNLYPKNILSIKSIKTILKNNKFIEPEFFCWYEKLSKEENDLLNILSSKYSNLNFTYYTFKTTLNKII